MLDYDSTQEIATVHWIYLDSQDQCFNEFQFKMKMFYPDSLISLLTENGLSIKNIWGSYEGEDFSEDSNLQIYECSLAD